MTPTDTQTLWRKVLEKMGEESWVSGAGPEMVRHIPPITLDALREISTTLSTDQQFEFLGHLGKVIGNRGQPEWRRAYQNINASKEHRLIALARVLGIKEGA